jgi:hypothetical protein
MLFSLLCACGAEDSGTAEATGPGTLALSFQIDDDLIGDMEEDGEAPVGTFGGSIFAEDQASNVGPVEGAVSLVDFEVELDLLPDGGPSAVLYTTEPLDPQIVWILGCLDSDANDDCGDVGDPITEPPANKVEILPEVETAFTVYMGMLRP